MYLTMAVLESFVDFCVAWEEDLVAGLYLAIVGQSSYYENFRSVEWVRITE